MEQRLTEWEIVRRMTLGDFTFVKDYNENHDPDNGQFTSGSGGGSRSYEELIPKNSYKNSDEYKKLAETFRDAWNKDDALRDKQSALEEQLKSEVSFKPKSEWTEEDKLYADIGLKPKAYTELGREIEKEIRAIRNERNEVREKRDRAGDEMNRIKEKEHRKQIKQYESTGLKAATKSDYEGFRTDTTGTSFYDEILKGEKPGFTGKLVEMSPKDYLQKCAYEIFDKATLESTIAGVSKEYVEKYKDMMKSGTKFDLPYLNFKQNQQEGRHRALAAYELGIETIPVLAIL